MTEYTKTKTVTQSLPGVLKKQMKFIMQQQNFNFQLETTQCELERRTILIRTMIEYISIQVHQIKSLSFALATKYVLKCFANGRPICAMVGDESFWRWCSMLVSIGKEGNEEETKIKNKDYFRPTKAMKEACEDLSEKEAKEYMNNQKQLKSIQNESKNAFANELTEDWKEIMQDFIDTKKIQLPNRTCISFILAYQQNMMKTNFQNLYHLYTEKRQAKIVKQQVIEIVKNMNMKSLNKLDLNRTTSWAKSKINNTPWKWKPSTQERCDSEFPEESKKKWLSRMEAVLNELSICYISEHHIHLPEDHNLTSERWRSKNMDKLIYYTHYLWTEYKRFGMRSFALFPHPKMKLGFININVNGIYEMYKLSQTDTWKEWFQKKTEKNKIWNTIPFNATIDWLSYGSPEKNITINWFLDNKELVYSRFVDMNRSNTTLTSDNDNDEQKQYIWECTNNLLTDGQQLKLVWERKPFENDSKKKQTNSFATRKEKQRANKKTAKENKKKELLHKYNIHDELENKVYENELCFQGCLQEARKLNKTIISVDPGRVTLIQAVRQGPMNFQNNTKTHRKRKHEDEKEALSCCSEKKQNCGTSQKNSNSTNKKRKHKDDDDAEKQEENTKKNKCNHSSSSSKISTTPRRIRNNKNRKKNRKEARIAREKEANQSTYSLYNKQYYTMCGFKSIQKMEQELRNVTGISDLDKRLMNVSYKTCELTELSAYFQVIFEPHVWNEYWNYANRRILRQWKFQRFQTQQSAFKKIARQLVGLSVLKKKNISNKEKMASKKEEQKRFSECVVIWGNGGFGATGSGGHDSAPNKKLRTGLSQFLPIIMVGERNTSKLTACCHWESYHPKHTIHNTRIKRNAPKDSLLRYSAKFGNEVRNVLYCKHPKLTDCEFGRSTAHIKGSRPWKRDVNGAVSILHRFLEFIINGTESSWSTI